MAPTSVIKMRIYQIYGFYFRIDFTLNEDDENLLLDVSVFK